MYSLYTHLLSQWCAILIVTVAPMLLLAALQVPSADFLCDSCFLVASYTASWQSVNHGAIHVKRIDVGSAAFKTDVVNMFFFRLSVGIRPREGVPHFLESIWSPHQLAASWTEVGHRIYYSLGPELGHKSWYGWVGRFGEKTCEPLMETLVGPSWLLQVAAMLAFDVSYHELHL